MASHVNKRRDIRPALSYAAYYSDGAFHASGTTENFTIRGGCLRGTRVVTAGMELVVLLIPRAKHALLIKKAKVQWVREAHFGVEFSETDCRTIKELEKTNMSQ
jgi:hypothetical protein